MNTYLIHDFNYEDTVRIILHHTMNYTLEEFKQICDEAYYECQNNYGDVDVVEMCDFLVENYGFTYPHIKSYNTSRLSVSIIDDGYV